MSLDTFYLITQIAAGVATTVSLIYVGIQIRQNTRTAKLAAIQSVQTAMGRLEELIIQDASFAEILKHGLSRPLSELPDADRIRLSVFYRHALRTNQIAHYQYRMGALDESVWEPQARQLSAILHADRGLREHFTIEKYMLDPFFVAFCEAELSKGGQWSITSGSQPLNSEKGDEGK